ncbi:MAG: CBS domain-containing protein [Polyangiaceae bacterium]
MPTARQVMTTPVVSIVVTATTGEALELLRTLDVRHLPVVNADDELVGMLSDRDLEPTRDATDAVRTASVSAVMSGNPLSVTVEADASEIVDLMVEHKIGAVPVVEPDGTLVGIVSYLDLLRRLRLD